MFKIILKNNEGVYGYIRIKNISNYLKYINDIHFFKLLQFNTSNWPPDSNHCRVPRANQ